VNDCLFCMFLSHFVTCSWRMHCARRRISTRPSVLSSLYPVKLSCASTVLTLATNDDHNSNVVTQFVYDTVHVIAEYVLILDHARFSDLYFCCFSQVACIMHNML
jgi:hypothetical protein